MALAEMIQRAWQKQASWLVLLRPLSWIYRGIFLVQKKQKSKHVYRAPIPVMVIGNITVGGSGKTPLIIALVSFLQQKKIKVAVISRGYGGKGPFPAFVNMDTQAQDVGDEPCLIVQQTQVPMAVGPNRQASIELLLSHYPETQLILSDDGLQHFALARDIEWVVVDAMRGFGNKKLLPEGYLREPISRLDDVTVIEHAQYPQMSCNMHLVAAAPYCLNQASALLFNQQKSYAAVVGIGYPQRFFSSLTAENICFTEHVFADHHQYTYDEITYILQEHDIITTGKDAVKIQNLFANQPELLAKVWVLPVQAKLSDLCYSVLKHQLQPFQLTW